MMFTLIQLHLVQLIQATPRVEAQITYTGGIGDLGINLWVDGTYQNTERTEAEASRVLRCWMQMLVLTLK